MIVSCLSARIFHVCLHKEKCRIEEVVEIEDTSEQEATQDIPLEFEKKEESVKATEVPMAKPEEKKEETIVPTEPSEVVTKAVSHTVKVLSSEAFPKIATETQPLVSVYVPIVIEQPAAKLLQATIQAASGAPIDPETEAAAIEKETGLPQEVILAVSTDKPSQICLSSLLLCLLKLFHLEKDIRLTHLFLDEFSDEEIGIPDKALSRFKDDVKEGKESKKDDVAESKRSEEEEEEGGGGEEVEGSGKSRESTHDKGKTAYTHSPVDSFKETLTVGGMAVIGDAFDKLAGFIQTKANRIDERLDKFILDEAKKRSEFIKRESDEQLRLYADLRDHFHKQNLHNKDIFNSVSAMTGATAKLESDNGSLFNETIESLRKEQSEPTSLISNLTKELMTQFRLVQDNSFLHLRTQQMMDEFLFRTTGSISDADKKGESSRVKGGRGGDILDVKWSRVWLWNRFRSPLRIRIISLHIS